MLEREIIVGLKNAYYGLTPEELFPKLDILEIKSLYRDTYELMKNNPNIEKQKIEELNNKIGKVFIIRLRGDVLDTISKLKDDPNIAYIDFNRISMSDKIC